MFAPDITEYDGIGMSPRLKRLVCDENPLGAENAAKLIRGISDGQEVVLKDASGKEFHFSCKPWRTDVNLLQGETKERGINQFIERRKAAVEHGHIRNEDLHAGKPCYFYCEHCGIFLERLHEEYLFPPISECSQCKGLREYDCLNEAESKVVDLIIPIVETDGGLKDLMET